MTKRAFIIHGWGGYPTEAWMPWLRRELEKRGFQVIAPEMPDKEAPNIESWVGMLRMLVGMPDKDTYFIGHSIGCQTILRYLASLPEGSRVGGMVCVAGFFSLKNLEPEEEPVAAPWLSEPIDTERVRKVAGRILAIFSDDDPAVPFENANMFKDQLGAKIVIEHSKGHFSEDSGVTELPSALEFFTGLD